MTDMATRSNAAGRAVPPQPGGTPGLAGHSGVAPPRRPDLLGRLASARIFASEKRLFASQKHVALRGNSRRRGHVGFC